MKRKLRATFERCFYFDILLWPIANVVCLIKLNIAFTISFQSVKYLCNDEIKTLLWTIYGPSSLIYVGRDQSIILGKVWAEIFSLWFSLKKMFHSPQTLHNCNHLVKKYIHSTFVLKNCPLNRERLTPNYSLMLSYDTKINSLVLCHLNLS